MRRGRDRIRSHESSRNRARGGGDRPPPDEPTGDTIAKAFVVTRRRDAELLPEPAAMGARAVEPARVIPRAIEGRGRAAEDAQAGEGQSPGAARAARARPRQRRDERERDSIRRVHGHGGGRRAADNPFLLRAGPPAHGCASYRPDRRRSLTYAETRSERVLECQTRYADAGYGHGKSGSGLLLDKPAGVLLPTTWRSTALGVVSSRSITDYRHDELLYIDGSLPRPGRGRVVTARAHPVTSRPVPRGERRKAVARGGARPW